MTDTDTRERIIDDIGAGFSILGLAIVALIFSPLILPAWGLGILARRRGWEWWR